MVDHVPQYFNPLVLKRYVIFSYEYVPSSYYGFGNHFKTYTLSLIETM